MESLRLSKSVFCTLIVLVTMLLTSGFAVAQEAPPAGPPVGRPPLVACVEGETIPCVELVDEISDIVGVWRRYFESATSMAYYVIDEDGIVSISVSPELGSAVISAVFQLEGGLASIAASEDSPAPQSCKTPGIYEIRLIRLGEQPVALTFLQVGEDNCSARVGDLSQPMLYYTGAELTPPPADAEPIALPLIPCPDEDGAEEAVYPCDIIATSPEDVAGVWKQYVGNPAFGAVGGMGYVRYSDDGSFLLADSVENTAAPSETFPFGTFETDGPALTFTVESQVPPECRTATYFMRVIRVGDQPVAMVPFAVSDDCVRRRDGDLAEALIWVAE
jgi:hypothetical protein